MAKDLLVNNNSETLVHALYKHLHDKPDQFAIGFLSEDGSLKTSLTYREVMHRAESVAAELSRLCERGDRAMLLFHGGEDFVVSFLGCLLAGVIAVAAYPVRAPASAQLPARNLSRLIPIFENAQPKVVITQQQTVDRQSELSAAAKIFAESRWIAIERVPHSPLITRPRISTQDIAFLQYTSGSTSAPKGVMVNHGNLVAGISDLHASSCHDVSSVMVTWIPVYHDMGLIYGILLPLYLGFPTYSLLPATVLQQPVRWLKAISQFRGTHSAAPNFAYELCVNRISEAAKQGLDLSSFRVCINGAETVRAQTLQRFAEAFVPYGLNPNTVRPGYGLAEATLKVSCTVAGEAAKTMHLNAVACEQGRVEQSSPMTTRLTRSFVGCGWTHIGSDIQIVNPQSREVCSPREIGEIWVSGSNITQGYWRKPAVSEETMRASLANGTGSYLRTGDLGFIAEGELFIAGRLKDLIIIRGRNLYPQDIELTIENAHSVVRLGRCCAFSVEKAGAEVLVVVAEVDRTERRSFDPEDAFTRLRGAVSTNHDVELYDAVLVRTGTFPLTSSGKVQRGQTRHEYLNGLLQVVAAMREAPPPQNSADDQANQERVAALQNWITRYIARRLQIPAHRVSLNKSFESVGLDSLALVEMTGEMEDILHRPIESSVVLDYPNIERLSAHLATQLAESSNTLNALTLALQEELHEDCRNQSSASVADDR